MYVQVRSVFRLSKMRENVAETADTVEIAPVGIDYGILDAFLLFYCHAHVQFYLRRVESFCSVNVRFHGNRKARYATIKI